MASWADEISAIIEKNIAGFGGSEVATASVGTVIAVQDGIARVYGLQDVKYLELVEFPRTGLFGMAFNLEEETVSCPILGDYTKIREDDEVRTTGRIIQVPVGDALLGRVVDPLGQPLDEGGPISTDKFRPVERVAPGVITRQGVNTPVQTGLKAIDSMIPIGRGQRELIIGDRQTGKTAIAIDTIINQKANDLCAYIPTNVISITDGQIFLETDLFNAGIRPAVNVGNSVSRVGGNAQSPAMKQVAGTLRLDLAQFRELAAFAQFSSDLDKVTKSRIDRGQRLTEVLKQGQYQPFAVEKQVMIIYAATQGYLDDVALDKVASWEAAFHRYMEANHPEIGQEIVEKSVNAKEKMSKDLLNRLNAAIEEFKQTAAPN